MKSQTKKIPEQFDKAEEVEEFAKMLIPKYHTHLVNSRIAYLFKNKELKKLGKTVIATVSKCSKKDKSLKEYDDEEPFDFVIIASYPIWRELNQAQKEAVVDHELCHCFVDEDENTGDRVNKLLSHDFEEFGSVIDRHGMYMHDLVVLQDLIKEKSEEKAEE